MKTIFGLLAFICFAPPLAAESPDAQAILDRTVARLSQDGPFTYSFRHQGPGAFAMTTGWAKVVMPPGDTRGRFRQARIEGRTRAGGQVRVAIDRPDIYALDAERKKLWHGTPRSGGLGLFNQEHLAPVFLLKALMRLGDGEVAWVGRQVIGQTSCNVVDCRSERLSLRLWIGEGDDLPRRIEAEGSGLFDYGALMIALDDWQTQVPLYEGDFALQLPEGYERAEYESAEGARWD